MVQGLPDLCFRGKRSWREPDGASGKGAKGFVCYGGAVQTYTGFDALLCKLVGDVGIVFSWYINGDDGYPFFHGLWPDDGKLRDFLESLEQFLGPCLLVCLEFFCVLRQVIEGCPQCEDSR